MTTQSIIVYRNPVEQMFWEGGFAFPLFAGLAAGFLTFVLLIKIAEMLSNLIARRHPPLESNTWVVSLISIVSFGAGGAMFHWLMMR